MKRKIGIRGRFVVALVSYTLVLTLIFTMVVYFLQQPFIEGFYIDHLKSELSYFASKYETDPDVVPADTRYNKSFLGIENLPSQLRDRIGQLPDGIHFESMANQSKTTKSRLETERRFDRHILKRENRGHSARGRSRVDWDDEHLAIVGIETLFDNRRIYMFAESDYLGAYMHSLKHFLVIAIVLFCALGVVLALFLSHRVTAPLSKLAGLINSMGVDRLPTGFSKSFKSDEFGILAKSLETSIERVKSFLTREQQFTRDASHELRTPVTAIKGAMELLQKINADASDKTGKLLKRVERSVIDMEITIESLLWLARETSNSDESSICSALPCVQRAMDQNRHLITDRPVKLTLVTEATPELKLPSGVFSIAVSNLIRNAIQFTTKGEIIITLRHNEVQVSDSGKGMDPERLQKIKTPGVKDEDSPGFGFGLDIVSRLCHRFGWNLYIDSVPDFGTTIRLVWS